MTTNDFVVIPSREWLVHNLALCLEAWLSDQRLDPGEAFWAAHATALRGTFEDPATCALLETLTAQLVDRLAGEAADHIWGNAAQPAQGQPEWRAQLAAAWADFLANAGTPPEGWENVQACFDALMAQGQPDTRLRDAAQDAGHDAKDAKKSVVKRR